MSTQVPTQVSGEVAEHVAAAAISLVKSVDHLADTDGVSHTRDHDSLVRN